MTHEQRASKRALDTALSSLALLVLWPVLVSIAILVRMTSHGPALYRHPRVGRGGQVFDVLKFRTMVDDPSGSGLQVTVEGDPRITPLGRHLRRHKLDELPQLWNVLRGEMSLVGPRPDVAGYADRLSGPAARLLEIRPGITGPATLYFRDEERMLADAGDLMDHYDSVVYPLKVRIDLEYLDRWSLARDMGYLIVTAIPSADRWLHLVPTDDALDRAEGSTVSGHDA